MWAEHRAKLSPNVGRRDDPLFDGDHRDIDVYEDLGIVVYMEEIEGDDDKGYNLVM